MRDDIHKAAPVAQHWKKVIKACENDADWSEEGPTAAAQAVINEIRRSLEPSFLAGFRAAIQKEQGELFIRDALARLTKGQQYGTLESKFLDHIQALASPGLPLERLVSMAAERTIRGCIQAHLRNIDAFLAIKFPDERTEFMQRLRDVCGSVPVSEFANQAASGTLPSHKAKRKTLDLDADLRKGS